MYTCPLIYESKLVMFLRNRNLRTVLYYDMRERIGGNKDIDKGLSPTDIIIPLCMADGCVVGYLEDYCLDRFEDKATLPTDVVQHLENIPDHQRQGKLQDKPGNAAGSHVFGCGTDHGDPCLSLIWYR